MMHPELFGKMIESTINKAKAGDVNAAKKLMELYCGGLTATIVKKGVIQKVNREPSIDERILRYFGECFSLMLSGDDPESAMNLKRLPNRPPDPALKNRDIDIAFEVDRRLKAGLKKTKTGIYDDLADEKHKGFDTIKGAEKKYRRLVEQVNEIDLLSILDELDAENEGKKEH